MAIFKRSSKKWIYTREFKLRVLYGVAIVIYSLYMSDFSFLGDALGVNDSIDKYLNLLLLLAMLVAIHLWYKRSCHQFFWWLERMLDNKNVRALILGGLILAQIRWLYKFNPENLGGVIDIYKSYPFDNGHIILTVLTFFVLWLFRTIDARQRIHQANLGVAMTLIASGKPVNIEMATQMCWRISRATSVFNKEIRIAFVKCLKRGQGNSRENKRLIAKNYRWSYAPHMLHWLKKYADRKTDLTNLDLSGQEFTSTTVKIKYADICAMHDTHYGNELNIDFGGCQFDTPSENSDKQTAINDFFDGDARLIAEYERQTKAFYKRVNSEVD